MGGALRLISNRNNTACKKLNLLTLGIGWQIKFTIMNNNFIRISFTILSIFQSAILLADDYSGHHVTDDSGGGFSLPTPIALALLLIVSIILIILNGGKMKDEKDGSITGCLGYVGLIAFVLFSIKACS